MGVDFRTTDTQVSLTRSPNAINMIAGENVFYPQKRSGYKRVTPFRFGYDGVTPINANGLHFYKQGDKRLILCHYGTNLYAYDTVTNGEPVLLYSALANSQSKSFIMNNKLFLLDGKDYYSYDGTTFDTAYATAFIPTTSVARTPAGAGTPFEEVNLLSSGRKNSFAADGSARAFTLDTKGLDATPITAVVNNASMVETTNFTVNRETGIVTFNVTPTKFTGADNVVITFHKTVSGSADKIKKCNIYGIYGGNSDTRVFLSGNPDCPNMDFASGLYDPTYFPDLGFTKIGSDNSAIVGYVKQYDSQLIIKGNTAQDATIYVRSFEIDGSGKALFPVRQGVSGIGCTAPNSINTLEDIPLFLTNDGVYAVYGTNIGSTRTMQNRSAFIDSKLLLEPNLSGAISVVYEGKYYLCVNGRCYIADSRQKNYDKSSDTLQYEWYFWDNIPAKQFLATDDALYFSTNDGRLLRFYRSDEDSIYNDDGEVINAIWRTPFMNLGNFHSRKNVRQASIVLQPFLKSSCTLSVMTDITPLQEINSTVMDIFNWNDIDFGRFTFNTFMTPQIWGVKVKQKKVSLVSLELSNSGKNEGFGLYAITLTASSLPS